MENINDQEAVETTCSAPINIAIIKYWGKSSEIDNIPLNSSFSLTLNLKDLSTTTSVMSSTNYEKDEVFINNEWQDISSNPRLSICFEEIRRLARKEIIKENADTTALVQCSRKVHVKSVNNFPTKAGLASSASGYAALTFALGKLLHVDSDLSAVARRGSGSACRSMYGGFVEWVPSDEFGNSTANQFVDETHWPEICVFILVVSSRQKTVGSTIGMKRTVESSALLKHRVEHIVPHRLKAIKEAVLHRDFCSFAEICMKESNQLHAVCMDTYPALHYLNAVSYKIMDFVHSYNSACNSTRVAYTFDAGPNAFLFTLQPFAEEVATQIYQSFPPSQDCDDFFRGNITYNQPTRSNIKTNIEYGLIEYVICTGPGPGPQLK